MPGCRTVGGNRSKPAGLSGTGQDSQQQGSFLPPLLIGDHTKQKKVKFQGRRANLELGSLDNPTRSYETGLYKTWPVGQQP